MECSTIQFTAKLVITPAWSTHSHQKSAPGQQHPSSHIPHPLAQPRALQNITKNCCQRRRRMPSLLLSLSIAKCKMYLNLSPSTTAPPPPPHSCHALLPDHEEGCLCWHLLRLSRAWVSAWERVCVLVCVYIKIYANAKVCAYVWAPTCVCVKWTEPFCPGEKQCKLRTERLELAPPLPVTPLHPCQHWAWFSYRNI